MHVGLPTVITINSVTDVEGNPDEIAKPTWYQIHELMRDIDYFENWSQLSIKRL